MNAEEALYVEPSPSEVALAPIAICALTLARSAVRRWMVLCSTALSAADESVASAVPPHRLSNPPKSCPMDQPHPAPPAVSDIQRRHTPSTHETSYYKPPVDPLGAVLTSMVLSSVEVHVFRGFTSGELGLGLAAALGLGLVGEPSGTLDGEAGGVDAAPRRKVPPAPVGGTSTPTVSNSATGNTMALCSEVDGVDGCGSVSRVGLCGSS